MGMLNDSFIAGEFAVERHAGSGEPDKRMEPQSAQGNFIKQADQIIAPFRVSHLMKQDGDQLLPVKQSIDANGKDDARIKKAVYGRSEMAAGDPHRYAIGQEAG